MKILIGGWKPLSKSEVASADLVLALGAGEFVTVKDRYGESYKSIPVRRLGKEIKERLLLDMKRRPQ